LAREHFIERMVKQNNLKKGAELGIWRGRVFLHLLRTCPDLTMIGVDSWKVRPEQTMEGGETYETWDMVAYEKGVRRQAREFGDRAIILKMDTTEAAKEVGDLDFIFIDAGHDYESVKRDIIDWKDKVRPGGFIIGHDWDWPTVRRAAEEFFTPTPAEDNVWWLPV